MKPQTIVAVVAIVALGVSAFVLPFDAISVFVASWYGVVGGVLVLRRPGNVVSWVLLLIAFAFMATTTPGGIDLPRLRTGAAGLGEFLPVWLTSWAGGLSFISYTILTLIFPSGRLPASRWRRAAIAVLTLQLVLVGLSAIAPTISFNIDGSNTVKVPNRLAILPDAPLWALWSADIAIAVVMLLMLAGAASFVVRYRRSSGVERLQMRWLVAAVTALVATVAFGLGSLALLGSDAWWAWLPGLVTYPLAPIAIGIAVLRYRLYDIDVVIRRTLVYGPAVAILAVVYAGLVLILQLPLAGILGGGTLPVAVSTLVVAGLFGPVRTRVQAIVDRRFYRTRYDAQGILEAFAASLREEVAIESVSARLADTARRAVRPTSAQVWIRSRPE